MSEGNGNQELGSSKIPEGFNIRVLKPNHPSLKKTSVLASAETGNIIPFRAKHKVK